MRMLANYTQADGFGLIATVTSMVLWLTALDIGLGPSLRNMLIRDLALSADKKRIDDSISSAITAAVVIAVTVAVVASAIIWSIPIGPVLNITNPDLIDPTRTLIIAAIWTTLLATPFALTRTVYAAEQREWAFLPWSVLGAIVGILFTWMAIRLDLGSTLAAIGMAIGMLVGNIAAFTQLCMHRPGIARPRLDPQLTRELLTQGKWFFLVQVCSIFIFQIGTFIANLILGNAAAGCFSAHAQVFTYIGLGLSLVTTPYWSAVGDALHRGDFVWIRRTLIRLTWIIVGLGTVASFIMLCIGPQLIPMMTHGVYGWDQQLGVTLAVGTVISGVVGVYALFLGAFGIVRESALIVMVQAIITPALLILGATHFGLTGIALGAIIAYLATSAWYVPLKLCVTLRK